MSQKNEQIYISNKLDMKKLSFDDVKQIVRLHKWRNITYIEHYKTFYSWVMDRQQELDRKTETRWMSNIASPIIYQLVIAVFWMYQDSKIAFEVYRKIKKAKSEDLTPEEQAKYEEELKNTTHISNQIIDLIEHIYDECDGSDEFDLSVLDAIILGNGFGGIGYTKSEETYEVTDAKTKWKYKITDKISRPNLYRIIPLNFFTELSASTQESAKVNIVRKIATATRINEQYKVYWVNFVPKKERPEWDIIEKKDWNMVLRFLIFNNMPFVTTLKNLWWENTYNGDSPIISSDGTYTQMHTDIWTDNSYNIGEDLHEIYEIHTDTTIQIFIDGEDQWGLYARLWPRKKKPFYKLGFRDWLNGLYDIGVGYLWYNLYKTINGFLNMRVDNDRLTGSAPLIVNADDNYFDGVDFLQQYPGKLIKVKDTAQSIKPLQLQSAGSGVANTEVDMLSKSVQDIVGVSGYKMGVQQKVERSAKGVNELVEAADASMKDFIDSIAKAKSFISKYITLLSIEYMDSKDLIKICGTDDLQTKLDVQELIQEYSINFNILSVSTLRDRQEVDTIKNLTRDYAASVRPDGTPLLNQEQAFRYIIEKSWAPADLILDEEDSLRYMKQQVDRNAELKKYEAEKNPQPTTPWTELTQTTKTPEWAVNTTTQKTTPVEWGPGIVPNFNAAAAWTNPSLWAKSETWVQGGSMGVGSAQALNPTGQNGVTQ